MPVPGEASSPSGLCEQQVQEIARLLDRRFPYDARIAVVAGSGLGGFVRSLAIEHSLDYAEIPHVGAATVVGHCGTLASATVAGTKLLVLNGRRHLYEGIGAAEATALLRALIVSRGVRVVVLSNAAGGLSPKLHAGDLMLISDQINWMFRNPLVGPNCEAWGERFPDLSKLYTPRLRELARQVALEQGVELREGVYIGCHGPSYETRAEVTMLRTLLGADAVGMSTVHEALVAAHAGCELLGISVISNSLVEPGKTTHEEVVTTARAVEEKFARLLGALVPHL